MSTSLPVERPQSLTGEEQSQGNLSIVPGTGRMAAEIWNRFLPNELFLYIVNGLAPRTVIAVACSCRRTMFLLSVVLMDADLARGARYGYLNVRSSMFPAHEPSQFSSLPALRLVKSPMTLGSLDIDIFDEGSVEDVRQATLLCEWLDKVNALEFWLHLDAELRTRGVRLWIPRLLRSLYKLNITDLTFLWSNGDVWDSSNVLGSIYVDASPLITLERVQMRFDYFAENELSRSFLTWIRMSFIASPLRSLSLSGNLDTGHYIPKLLMEHTFPHLRTLDICCNDLSLRYLLLFLGRHTELQDVRIGESDLKLDFTLGSLRNANRPDFRFALGGRKFDPFVKPLSMSKLSARPDYICVILEYPRSKLSKLTTVHVEVPCFHTVQARMTIMEQMLIRIGRHCQIEHLHLSCVDAPRKCLCLTLWFGSLYRDGVKDFEEGRPSLFPENYNAVAKNIRVISYHARRTGAVVPRGFLCWASFFFPKLRQIIVHSEHDEETRVGWLDALQGMNEAKSGNVSLEFER